MPLNVKPLLFFEQAGLGLAWPWTPGTGFKSSSLGMDKYAVSLSGQGVASLLPWMGCGVQYQIIGSSLKITFIIRHIIK